MDTGGLGLLQQLLHSGFPPQLLMQLLAQQSRPNQEDIGGAGGAPGGPTGLGNTGATNSGPGTPGVGPTNSSIATGIGNMTGQQAIDAAIQGAIQGIPGFTLGQNIAEMSENGPTVAGVGKGIGQAASLIGTLANPNPASLAVRTAFNAIRGVARGAQASMPTQPQTFEAALKDMTQGLKDMTLRSFFGLQEPDLTLAPPAVPPDQTFEFTGNVPTGPATAPTGLPEGLADAISAAVAGAGGNNGPPGGPTGEGPSSGPAGTTGEF